MPEVESRRHVRRSRWFVAGCAVMIAALLVLVLVLDGRFSPTSPERPTAASPTAATREPSDGGGSSAGDAPAVVPFSSVQKLSMTFPDRQSTDKASFAVEAGEDYLVSFDVNTEKPAGSDGVGFMLGVRLSCTDESGEVVGQVGGTENLNTGKPVTLSNQFLFSAGRDGIVTCVMLANAPNAEVAAKGTQFGVDVTWKVVQPVGVAVAATPLYPLPLVIPARSTKQLLSRDIPVSSLTQRHLDVLTSLQLTTCTNTGGSTEDGTQWCAEGVIDPTGSHFRFEVRYDVIDADGSVCGTIDSGRRSEYLDTYRHHQLYHVGKSVKIPADLCGDTIRTSVNLRNEGPAGLLVHRQNTSMVTMETRHAT